MTTVVIPDRSLEQRKGALERANEVRLYRARLKRDLNAGRLRVHKLIAEPDERIETMKVWELLQAQRSWGRVKVGHVFRHLGMSPSKTVGGLSPRQRRELAEYLR